MGECPIQPDARCLFRAMASAIQFLSGSESVRIQLSDHIREDKGTKKRKKNDPLEKEKRIEKLIPHLSEHHCARITRLVIPHVAKHMGSLSPEDKERAMEGVPQVHKPTIPPHPIGISPHHIPIPRYPITIRPHPMVTPPDLIVIPPHPITIPPHPIAMHCVVPAAVPETPTS